MITPNNNMATQIAEQYPKLQACNRFFLMKVVEAMQHAEETGGPEGKQYETLMDCIVLEAQTRRHNCAAQRKGKRA